MQDKNFPDTCNLLVLLLLPLLLPLLLAMCSRLLCVPTLHITAAGCNAVI
jgi:hypothetical protein